MSKCLIRLLNDTPDSEYDKDPAVKDDDKAGQINQVEKIRNLILTQEDYGWEVVDMLLDLKENYDGLGGDVVDNSKYGEPIHEYIVDVLRSYERVIDRPIPEIHQVSPVKPPKPNCVVPDWVKLNAKWWSAEQISDDEFANGIEYLINQGIIKVGSISATPGSNEIPSWIKNNAAWWAEGLIDTCDFTKGIEYLVQNGIILLK